MPEVVHPSHVQFGHKLTEVPVGSDLPSAEEIQDELIYYCDVLLGKRPPPVDSPYLDLCEIATAYFARACDLEIRIYWEEQQQRVMRGHPLYKMRTGQLRTFMDMAKRMSDLGSRRLTQEQLLHDQRYDEGDSYR
jgi:hypothetical protein